VASALTHSGEYYSHVITAAYQSYLGRGPDAAGLSAWLAAMQYSGVSDERLEAGFLGSPEYIALHGGEGAGWVRGMYHDLLGRTPLPDEVAGWVRALELGANPTDVAYGFAASAEREGQRVQDDYFRYLGRAASDTEVGIWVNAFVGGDSNENVIAGFVGSPEAYARDGNSNTGWLTTAFQQVLGRNPQDAEAAYWLGVLGQG
jgi:hypothetical protein